MGHRCRRGGAAGFHRPDIVVSRTAATQSRTAAVGSTWRTSTWRRPSGSAGQDGSPCQGLSALGPWRVGVGAAAGVSQREVGARLSTGSSRRPVREPTSEVANRWRAAASKPPGRVHAGRKRGPGQPADAGAGRAPVSRWRAYSVCSKRNAWALIDPLPAAAVTVRNARAVLASLAVRAPRTGTTWSRYSVTAL